MQTEFPAADVLLMAAAVSDFRPAVPDAGKIKKAEREGLTLDFEPTQDVLGGVVAARGEGQTIVGFAAEHGDGGAAEARAKLRRKGLDAIVLNDISRPDIGFDAPDNEVTILTSDRERRIERGPKADVAAGILDEVQLLRSGGLEVRG